LNFNGCFCGATCLRLARDIIRAGESTGVLVVAVEVASTHYDLLATDASSLVAYSLFTDGGVAMAIAPEGEWRYKKTGMSLIPDSAGLLKLNPPLAGDRRDYRMYSSKHVGNRFGDYFHHGYGKEILADACLDRETKGLALAIHPSGPSILDRIMR